MSSTPLASWVLASWNDGPAKKTITDYVTAVVDESGSDFLPVADRIATFDNDGTLWCEKPVLTQLALILRQLAAQVKADPSLKSKQPWKAVADNDTSYFEKAIDKHYDGDDSALKPILGGVLGLNDGKPVSQVEDEGRKFVYETKHPTLGILYKDAIFQPMIELLQYLGANGFTIYIVSGGGRDFMRGFTDDLYNVPRERVIGSRVKYRYEEKDGKASIVETSNLSIIDDGEGKATEIWNVIGRRPAFVSGNANGDLQMMALARDNAVRLLINHDDDKRDIAYTDGAEKAVATVKKNDWTLVSVKNDWATVYQASSE